MRQTTLVAALAAGLVFTAVVYADPAEQGSNQNPFLRLVFDQTTNVPGKTLQTVTVSYPPEARSAAHHHAKSAFIMAYVMSGAIRSQLEGQPARIYHGGETWSEPPARTTRPVRMPAPPNPPSYSQSYCSIPLDTATGSTHTRVAAFRAIEERYQMLQDRSDSRPQSTMKVLQEVRSPCIRDDLQVMTIVIDHPPGAPGYPPHRLPGGPGFGYMISGEMVFEIEGEAPRVLRAGDAFWGPGGDVIHYQDANHRADIPCSFVLTLLCEPGKPMLELVTEQDLEDRKSLRVRPTDIDAATGNSSENARVHQWREATRDFVLTGATAMLATEPPQSLGSISITLTGSALSNHLLLADTGNIALTSVGDHSVARGRYPMSVVPMRLDVLDEPPAIRVMGHGLSGPTQLRVMIELTARNSRTDTTSVMTCAVGSVLLDAQAPLAVLDFCLQRGDRSSRDGTGAQ